MKGMIRSTVITMIRVAAVAVLAGMVSLVSAQTDRGTIEGFVTDATGAAVPGARVQIVQVATNVVTELATNESGRYFAPNMPLGSYRVIVEKSGFRGGRLEQIQLQSQSSVRGDFKLQVGSLSESIEVPAVAPLLDASTATLTTGLTTKYIEELPLISMGGKRNIASYMKFIPGTDREATGSGRVSGSAIGNAEVFVDGAPASNNLVGGVAEASPAIEHVGEFNIVTNAFNAEYGRTGTWFMNVTLRSGTNEVHGSLYEYFANSKLNARSFFQKVVPVVKQSEAGLTLGGPVYIPKVYDGRNRTFFFYGQQLFFNRRGATGSPQTTAREDFRTGDFSRLLDSAGNMIPIFDPLSTVPDGKGSFVRTQFAENRIPSERISGPARKIVDLMPKPDLPNLQNQNFYNRIGSSPRTNTFVETSKVDHSFSPKHKIAVTYIDEYYAAATTCQGWGLSSPLEACQDPKRLHTRTGRINHDYIFAASILSHFTVGVDRYNNTTQQATTGQGWDNKLGIRGLQFDFGAFPQVLFTGGTTLSDNMGGMWKGAYPAIRWSFNENLTWIKGRHSMKFGFAYGRENHTRAESNEGTGTFTFNSLTTSQPNATKYSSWGNSFASFLLGDLYEARTRSYANMGQRQRYGSIFAQDEWRVTQKLTVSYGLRWEFYPASFDVHDQVGTFDMNTPNPGAGGRLGALVFAGEGPGRTGLRKISDDFYRAAAPRLGLAYQATPKTVVRASGGIYYAIGVGGLLPAYGFKALPVFQSTNGFTPVYNWGTGSFPAVPLPPFIDPTLQNGQSLSAMFRDSARPPQILSWTASIQRQLSRDMVLELTYIGSHSTHLTGTSATKTGNYDGLSQFNTLDPKYLSMGTLLLQRFDSPAAIAAGITSPFPGFESFRTVTVAQALRPYPQYLDIAEDYGPRGIGRFNSLQVRVNRRYSSGLTLLGFYVWMKNMTNAEGGGVDMLGAREGTIQNPLNRAGEVSVSMDGYPHTFVVSCSYDLPFGPGKALLPKGGALGHVVGGWQVVAFVRRNSGSPLSVTVGNNLRAFGYPYKRANYVSGQEAHLVTNPRDFEPSKDRFLNSEAFSVPGAYEFGNTARVLDWARGWTGKTETLSLGKIIKISERVNTKFVLEADNPFNFVRWSNPNTNRSSADFGRVTSAGSGRLVQLNLRLEF